MLKANRILEILFAYCARVVEKIFPCSIIIVEKGRENNGNIFKPREGRLSGSCPLKWDKSTEGAIAQIKRQNYTKNLENLSGNLLLIGISYDKKTKKHECTIEK